MDISAFFSRGFRFKMAGDLSGTVGPDERKRLRDACTQGTYPTWGIVKCSLYLDFLG